MGKLTSVAGVCPTRAERSSVWPSSAPPRWHLVSSEVCALAGQLSGALTCLNFGRAETSASHGRPDY